MTQLTLTALPGSFTGPLYTRHREGKLHAMVTQLEGDRAGEQPRVL